MASLHRTVPFFIALGVSMAAAQNPPARHEIVRGRVTSDSGRPVPNAQVIVVRTTDRLALPVSTDSSGRYASDWPNGSGDYTVHVTGLGFAPATRHIVRTGSDSVLIADVPLDRAGADQQLAPVVTTAQRPVPSRDVPAADPTSATFTTVPQNAARRLAPDQAGDLAAIAAMAPGVLPVPGGISVFGLGAAQNATTLNGMAFGSADVPRDAFTRVRLTTSSYDPSVGWFSGARTQVDLVPGDLFTQRNAHLTVDAPAAQWTDPVSAHLGQRFANVNGSLGGMGQLIDDKWAYNYGIQGGHKTSDFASLGNAGGDLLDHVGVSSDSVAGLLRLLAAERVPLTTGAPLSLVNDNISFIGRIDHIPFDWKTLQPARTTWGITGYGKFARTEGQGLGPTGTPAHAGTSTQQLASLQAEWSTYFGHDYLADLRSAVSYGANGSDPYLRLPDGRVLVASTIPGAAGAVSTLAFGGNSALGSTTRNGTWESVADVQLYPPGATQHKLRFTADARFDETSQDIVSNTYGSFTYNSLADLAANTPASFTRLLGAPVRNGAAWNAFAALGDAWRLSPNLQLRYGVRAEGTVFGDVPANNPAVASTFGARTDHAPDAVGLSPRLGFQYNVPGTNGRPLGAFRGGVGEFRNLLDPSLLAAASVMTGLPNGVTQLACYGAAAPTPNWAAYDNDRATIPAQCAGGAPSAFTDLAPTVRLFDPSFAPMRSWRGNLAWSSTAFHSPYAIDATLSHNLGQAGTQYLNFSGVPRFHTSDEGRPVYADPTSIATSTGVVSPVDSRRTSSFGAVSEGVSDLRSETRQLTFTLRPYLGQHIVPYLGDFDIGYTLARIRDELRGFDQSTFGDPRVPEWARAALDARHQFVTQGVIRPHPGWLLFFTGHVQSGTPYTPLVGSDVNGDGLVNDRAFVFDPARTANPAVAAGLRTLLATTSSQARDCLLRQLGGPAGRDSCETPWSASFNTSLRIDGGQVLHNDRLALTVNFANPLGGLDQLLHGSDHLAGWGTVPVPDPVLLDVHGFDPSPHAFSYIVNPRFGATSAAFTALRAPFRVTLDLSIDVAPPQTMQQLDRWLRPGRAGRAGQRVSAADLARRYQRTVPDPYAEVLAESDSLLLTSFQIDSLRTADTRYRAHVDSIWVAMANYLAALPDRYSAAAAYQRSDASTDDGWELTRRSVQRDFRAILTPDQLVALPPMSRLLYNSVAPVHLRIFPRGG